MSSVQVRRCRLLLEGMPACSVGCGSQERMQKEEAETPAPPKLLRRGLPRVELHVRAIKRYIPFDEGQA